MMCGLNNTIGYMPGDRHIIPASGFFFAHNPPLRSSLPSTRGAFFMHHIMPRAGAMSDGLTTPQPVMLLALCNGERLRERVSARQQARPAGYTHWASRIKVIDDGRREHD
jgi:hypothetical protein